jgi:hypothetical protein
MDTLNQESDNYKSRHIHLDNGEPFWAEVMLGKG